ncbi:glycosyltransferase [Parerythrobacter aestuarii]|uniref:glycosyltransferase n=1 Tax=Parerythrobacter aestuarii TaxID=3020909 RepID=UPI0024DE9E31|nr:glycosyltransferase [Parerythrobacter aestuarii]
MKFDAIGGMQTQIYRQTLALSHAGIRQTILTLKIPGAPRVWDVDERTRVIGVRIPLLPIRSRLRGMADLNSSWAAGVLSQIGHIETPDVIHCHWSGVSIPPLLSRYLKRSTGIPSIATVHCSSLVTYHAMSRLDHLQHMFARKVEASALVKMDAVVTLTQRTEKRLQDLVGINPAKTWVVPDSIDTQAFGMRAGPMAKTRFQNRHAIPSDRPVVGYVGRIAREKGWRGLLELAKSPELANAVFLICGDGNERDLLANEIERQDLASRFIVTGYIPNEDVAIALSCCDVFVLPSRHEEFGSVLLEAMTAGIPCVAFRVGGIPDVLADGEAGVLVTDGDFGSMARSIAELLASPDSKRQLTNAATERVNRYFSQTSATRMLTRIYQSLIGQSLPKKMDDLPIVT